MYKDATLFFFCRKGRYIYSALIMQGVKPLSITFGKDSMSGRRMGMVSVAKIKKSSGILLRRV